jgi:hypothetical protein
MIDDFISPKSENEKAIGELSDSILDGDSTCSET